MNDYVPMSPMKLEIYDDISNIKNLFSKDQLKEFSDNIKKWQAICSAEKSIKEMYALDRQQLTAILKTIKTNNYQKASYMIRHLDSELRLLIPDRIRNTVNEFYDGKQFTFEQIKMLYQ
jgi:DNA mismatch repair ATPase MutL